MDGKGQQKQQQEKENLFQQFGTLGFNDFDKSSGPMGTSGPMTFSIATIDYGDEPRSSTKPKELRVATVWECGFCKTHRIDWEEDHENCYCRSCKVDVEPIIMAEVSMESSRNQRGTSRNSGPMALVTSGPMKDSTPANQFGDEPRSSAKAKEPRVATIWECGPCKERNFEWGKRVEHHSCWWCGVDLEPIHMVEKFMGTASATATSSDDSDSS